MTTAPPVAAADPPGSTPASTRQDDAAPGDTPLSLYVHLPWCVRKCPYCDFNSHEQRGALPFEAYVDALLLDLEQDLPLARGRTVQTIFFGGGTPSLFPAAAVDRFLQAASARLAFAPGLEITLETNPGTAEHGRFEDYRSAGINRLSLGIQSFDDGCLQRLGRIHDGAQAADAFAMARHAGFDDINIDLMYALPGQTLPMALDDVVRAIDLQPTHLSHYQLTLEPNTVFAARPPAGVPDVDAAWDMQEACQALIAAAGYTQYEVSAYARPGRQCAHNLNYWRFGDYLGIGAGAHGKLDGPGAHALQRRWKIKHPTAYLAAAASGIPAQLIGGHDVIAPVDRPFEFMLNALRLVEGFPLALFEARTALPRDAIAAPLALAASNGWLQVHDGHVRLTAQGQRFNNDVINLFLGD